MPKQLPNTKGSVYGRGTLRPATLISRAGSTAKVSRGPRTGSPDLIGKRL